MTRDLLVTGIGELATNAPRSPDLVGVVREAAVAVRAGDTLDCVCGFGNGNYGGDSTALDVVVKSDDGKTYNAAADFSIRENPSGVWSYGQMTPAPAPKAETAD